MTGGETLVDGLSNPTEPTLQSKEADRSDSIMWAFIIFNVFAALGLYWLARVPKVKKDVSQRKASIEKEKALVQVRSNVSGAQRTLTHTNRMPNLLTLMVEG